MTKANLVLLSILIACALALVTAQHQARELQKEQELAKVIDVEWGQLQLEQSTWAMHARIEKIAARDLHMRTPSASQTQVVSLHGPADR